MNILNAQFVTSVADYANFTYGGIPQFAFAGRSNAGKSTFINKLVNQKLLAKTSKTPGLTKLVNLFSITAAGQIPPAVNFYFADLPGYGYKSGVSKAEAEKWQGLIEAYLTQTEALRRVFLLVDSRIPPAASDIQMAKYLYGYGIPFTVLAAKCDKLKQSETQVALTAISQGFGVGHGDIVLVSGVTGSNTGKVLEIIERDLAV
ncbi:MAG: ribosome biogenesis GTP-binding protein YihA/YsxC [Firmicutes bacterium]|nr:ribosome biogenesis GTP-binding protein YihA/YsxC [Bacillota bacterium]